MLLLVFAFGVGVPYLDEFSWVGLHHEFTSGNLAWKDIWAQDGAQRDLIPKLIALPVLIVTRHDSRALMLLSWVCVLAVIVVLLSLSTRAAEGRCASSALVLIASWLLFNPLNWSTFFDGFQLTMTLCFALTATGLYVLCSMEPSLKTVLLASVALLLASLCSLPGLFAWPAAILLAFVLAPKGNQIKSALIPVVGCFLSLWANVDGVARSTLLIEPHAAFVRMLGILGEPVSQGWPAPPNLIAPFAGGLALVLFAGSLALVILQRKRSHYGIAAVACFAAFCCAAASIAGPAWGTGTLTSALLWSCLAIGWSSEVHVSRKGFNHIPVLAGMLVGAMILSSLAGVGSMLKAHRERSLAKITLPFLTLLDNATDETRFSPLWGAAPLLGRSSMGAREGLSQFGDLRGIERINAPQFILTPIENPGQIMPMGGAKTLSAEGVLRFGGWASIPARGKPAEIIGITINDSRNFITFAMGGQGDTVFLNQYFPDGRYRRAGWSVEIPASVLPKGKIVIHAWAWDPDTKSFAWLQNQMLESITVM